MELLIISCCLETWKFAKCMLPYAEPRTTTNFNNCTCQNFSV